MSSAWIVNSLPVILMLIWLVVLLPKILIRLTELRKSLLKPLLVSAAAQGNVSSLKAALANPYNQKALSRLTDKQVELVTRLQSASFYNQTEDSGFINSTLENTVDKEGEALESMKANYELLGEVSEAALLAACLRAARTSSEQRL